MIVQLDTEALHVRNINGAKQWFDIGCERDVRHALLCNLPCLDRRAPDLSRRKPADNQILGGHRLSGRFCLAVIVRLRPFGKKPPCFTPAFAPNARSSTCHRFAGGGVGVKIQTPGISKLGSQVQDILFFNLVFSHLVLEYQAAALAVESQHEDIA